MDEDFLNAIEAYREVTKEIASASRVPQKYLIPMENVMMDSLPLPDEALFIGMASDHLPVLLNIEDAYAPHILVTEMLRNQGAEVLKVAADYISRFREDSGKRSAKRIEFVVFTSNATDWDSLSSANEKSCIGIIPFGTQQVDDIILSLASWAHDARQAKHPVIILIDGIENLDKMDFDTRQNLRWLLVRGANSGIHVIATVNVEQRNKVEHWVQFFRCEISGQREWGTFMLREGSKDVLFWTPQTGIG